MSNSRETITRDIVFNIRTKVTDAERAASEIKNALSKINVSEDLKESLSSALVGLTANIDKLKGKLSSTMSPSNIQKWNQQWNGVSDTLNDIARTISGGKLSPKDIIFDETTQERIDEIEISLKRIAENKSKINKNVGARTDALVSGLTKENQLKTAKDLGLTVQAQKDIYSATFKNLDNEQAINDLLSVRAPKYKEILAAQQKINSLTEASAKASAEASALKDEVLNSKSRLTNDTKQKILASSAVDTTGLDITSNKAAFLAAFDKTSVTDYSTAIKEANAALVELQTNQQQQAYTSWSSDLVNSAKQLASTLNLSEKQSEQLKQELISLTTQGAQKAEAGLADFKTVILQLLPLLKQVGDTAEEGNLQLKKFEDRQAFFSDIQSRITQVFGLTNAYQNLTRFIRSSWTAIKELDAAFTEIAVVTDKTTSQLWESFETYNKMAQQLGVTTTDAIETSALYYQQGLGTADVMTLTTETIKMARIANMDFADATKAMTSAIRGFKLEMSDAQTITDTYSALAAEAAVDTDQLATAISKTASIAGSAGLSLEDTSAFLTQIIETTQEAPETAGTALKTIIARFTELKKNPAALKVEVEGEDVSANKVEEALKTANVALRDTEGNFRDLDEVFLELSSKWDSLDRNTQRYIATTAAGSRQQSRFIAMMDNYKRTMELVGIANDSAGAGAVQFAKTLDSVGARVNKLKSNFEALIGNLVENDTVKAILDTLNAGMKILVNASEKGIVAFSALIFLVGKTIKNALSLIVSHFAKVSKENETLRTKIGRIIKVPVVYEPDVSAVNQVNQQLKANPVMVPSSKVVPKPGDSDFIGPLRQTTSQTFTSAISGIKGPLISTVASGVSTGLLVGFASDDWKLGLASGLTSTITNAIGNPKIMSAIGSISVKGGASTIGKVLAGIGKKLAVAFPIAGIIAGIGLIGYGLYKWLDPLQKANRELKKAQDNLDKVNSSLEKTRANYLSDISSTKSISSNIENYKKLTSQTHLTVSEQEDYNKIVNELAEQFPQLITGYDELGNAVIDQKTSWKEILEIQKQIIAKSQGIYARDVMASADAEEGVRSGKLKKAKEELSNTYTKGLGRYKEFSGVAQFFGGQSYEEKLADRKRLEAEINALGEQEVLTAQRIDNAYSQVASSVINSYNAIQTAGKDRIDKEESSLLETGITTKLKGNEEKLKKLSGDTSEKGIKKYQEYLDELEVETSAFITSFQATLNTTGLDASEVAKAMATKTAEEFKKYLIANGLTSGEIFDYLVGLSDEQENNVEKLLGKTKVDPEKIKEFFNSGTLIDIFNRMGEANGAAYLDGLYYALQGIDPTKQKEIAEYLSGLDLTDLDIAKEATAVLLSKYGLNTEQATNIILRFVDQNGNPITSQTLLEQTGLQEYFANEENPDIGSIALQELNSTGLTLDTVKSLIEDFPELSGILRKFSEDVDITTEDIVELKKAIAEASNNKKSIAYFKKLSEQIEVINDTTSTGYAKRASKDILKDSLGITDLPEANEFIDTYLSDIEAAANGSVEAWNRVQVAIKEAKLAAIGYGDLFPEEQEAATGFLNEFMNELDELSNGDYSADFTLNGVDNTDRVFTNIIGKLEGLFGNVDDAIAYLETLGGISIEPVTERVQVAPPEGQEDRAVYQRNGGFMTVPKITYRVTKKNNYDPGSVGRGGGSSGGGGGGGGENYEVKVDKYYNEIAAIDDLNDALEKLADAREHGNLSPEDYRKNLDTTANYYKQLQDKLHSFNESLRADQAEIAKKITNLKAPNAINIVNGILKVDKEALELLSETDKETADGLIEDWDKIGDAISENSDAWMEAKYKLEELADSYRDSFTETEDKIRAILIQQDQDEIDEAVRKYDKLKEADEDYLEALRDNIDKRRRARDKETDYNDLAKKEKRLALLKRDTSGVYGAEILSLEEEIAQTRRELSDKEVDDMVDSLEEQATTRADSYDKELKEMQESQKDKEKSMADYNKEVDKIMQSGAENVLKWLQTYDEEYITASETAQKKYLEGWKNTINEANSYVDNVSNGRVVTTKEKAASDAQVIYEDLKGTTNTATGSENATYAEAVADIQQKDVLHTLQWFLDYVHTRPGIKQEDKQKFWNILKLKAKYEGLELPKLEGYYSKGGLVNSTGLAMVHGSETRPEAFLSAADTKNFQILMELLNKAVNYNGKTQSDIPTAFQIGECQIIVEVGSIADDYDVDQAIDKVKQSIIDNSNYRNVNIVTRRK